MGLGEACTSWPDDCWETCLLGCLPTRQDGPHPSPTTSGSMSNIVDRVSDDVMTSRFSPKVSRSHITSWHGTCPTPARRSASCRVIGSRVARRRALTAAGKASRDPSATAGRQSADRHVRRSAVTVHPIPVRTLHDGSVLSGAIPAVCTQGTFALLRPVYPSWLAPSNQKHGPRNASKTEFPRATLSSTELHRGQWCRA